MSICLAIVLPNELPSALIGRPAPEIGRLEALRDDPPPTAADLTAPGVKLVNFWAAVLRQ